MIYLILAASSLLGYASESSRICDFYLKKDKVIKCSLENNYLKEYGLKYCERFTALEENKTSSVVLKQWISSTRTCLQEMIEINKKRYSRDNCTQLKDFAFDVHPICYKQYGVCNLPPLDISKVAKLLIKNDFLTDFEKEKRATFMQVGNVLTSCLAVNKTISVAGEIFYNLYLKSSITLSASAAAMAVEIIDRAPDAIDKMQDYFQKVLRGMKKDEIKNLNGQQMTAIMQSSSIQYDQSYNLSMSTNQIKPAVGFTSAQVIKIQKAFNAKLTDEQLKIGLQVARTISRQN